jgi:hypothetical protein
VIAAGAAWSDLGKPLYVLDYVVLPPVLDFEKAVDNPIVLH